MNETCSASSPRLSQLSKLGGAGVETSFRQGCQNAKKNSGVFCCAQHDEMFLFLMNGFRLPGNKNVCQSLKKNPRKHLHRVSRDKILYDSWSVVAALSRRCPTRHFENGEGPRNKVKNCQKPTCHKRRHTVGTYACTL